MGLLNLTLLEFLSVLIPLSTFLVALYFYDRSRRRQIVSALRFWPRRAVYPTVTRRKKLQQPWSLLLQLLAMLLLLLAIADWRFDVTGKPPRHHVVILETSALMRASLSAGDAAAANSGTGSATLMDAARQRARAYLRAIPRGDLVMVIHADANPTPATRFTADRAELEQAILEAEAGWTAVHLAGAFELAQSSLRLAVGADGEGGAADLASSNRVGEVAYIGSGRVEQAGLGRVDTAAIPFPRFIEAGEVSDDVGLRRLTAQRDAADPARWQVVAEVHNYDALSRPVRVDFAFEDKSLGHKNLELPPGESGEITFSLRTRRAGPLTAELADDGFALNNQARLDLPAYRERTVEVYSENPELWRTLVAAAPGVRGVFRRPGEYRAAESSSAPSTALRLFDRVAPPSAPAGIYFRPPTDASPVTVARTVEDARIIRWTEHPVAQGLESRDVVLDQASVFEAGPNDTAVAETAAGPVIVARSAPGSPGAASKGPGSKTVVVGFHPSDAGVENQLLTPLLFAKILHWLSPDVFLSTQLRAAPPGLIETVLEGEREEDVTVSSAENPVLPWSLSNGRLRFYAALPGTVQVRSPYQRLQFALNLPEIATARWEPQARVRRGVPPPARTVSGPGFELWPWLAFTALVLLAADWHLFGRSAAASAGPPVPSSRGKAARTILLDLEDTEAQVRERQAVH